jgi:hypothetical protein
MLFSLSDGRDLLINHGKFRQTFAQQRSGGFVHTNKNARNDMRQSTHCRLAVQKRLYKGGSQRQGRHFP